MNFKKCLLLSYVWITENQDYKKDIIDFSVRHFRANNPDLYIILTGHGQCPHEQTIDMCDFYYWSDFKIDEVGKGHPKLVHKGLAHAKEKGFERILKQRADCIIAYKNIHNIYDGFLQDKKLLGRVEKDGINDLLMYGDTDVFLSGWKIDAWDANFDGVYNFTKTVQEKHKESFIFIDTEVLRWVYLDPYWEIIKAQNIEAKILENDFDYKSFLWGPRSSLRAQSRAGIDNKIIG